MQTEEFIQTVKDRADLESTEIAADVSEATLQTLGERISDGQAAELAAELPQELAGPLEDPEVGEAEEFGLEEFLERVSQRAETEADDMLSQVRAVAEALSEATDRELADTREQLPSEFDLVFEPGEPMDTEAFLTSVQRRADLESADQASEATAATLAVLHERIGAGELEKLMTYLPEELEIPVEPADQPEAFPVEAFLNRVAQLVDIQETAAERRVRAVLSTIAEAASEHEIRNVRSQLPHEYDRLFEPPGEDGG